MSREVGGRSVGTCKGPRDQDGETLSRAARVFLVRRGMGLGWRWFLASVDGFERVIGDWELGMDEPDQESRAPGEWTAASGIKRVEQGTGPGPGGRGRRASNGEGGSERLQCDGGRRTRKCDYQENKHPEIPRFSGKQSATTTTTFAMPCVIFVLAHWGWYHRASAP